MGSWSDRRPLLLCAKPADALKISEQSAADWQSKDAIKLSVGNFTTISSKPLPPACLQESLILCTKFKVEKIEQIRIGL